MEKEEKREIEKEEEEEKEDEESKVEEEEEVEECKRKQTMHKYFIQAQTENHLNKQRRRKRTKDQHGFNRE